MDREGLSLDRMRTFVRVAERGNLSKVARELGVGQSTVTRHLNELEDALGVPLLSRTTRRVTLTDEGSRYYTNCLQILRLVEQAAEEARDARQAPAGAIRLSCSAALGVMHVTRLIFKFHGVDAPSTNGIAMCQAGAVKVTQNGESIHERNYHNRGRSGKARIPGSRGCS